MSNDNTKLIEAIKDAENAIVKALNVLKTIASETAVETKHEKASRIKLLTDAAVKHFHKQK